MPWSAGKAMAHTKQANTPEKRRRWARIANHVLERTGDERLAIMMANKSMHAKDDK